MIMKAGKLFSCHQKKTTSENDWDRNKPHYHSTSPQSFIGPIGQHKYAWKTI